MSVARSSLPAVVVWSLSLCALVAAQVAVPPPGPRDSLAPQPPTEFRFPIGTAKVSGTVVSADGRPVVGATVGINGVIPQNMAASTPAVGSTPAAAPGRGLVEIGMRGGVPGGVPVGMPGLTRAGNATPPNLSRQVQTDASGQFSFARMPAGQFMVNVNHNQFIAMVYGQRRSGGPGTYLQLADGQELTLKIQMMRGGVISGRVLAPDGSPQQNAQVRAWRYSMQSGTRRLEQSGYATADDRGAYRMFGLRPGEYVVAATPMDLGGGMRDQTDQIERAIASGQVNPPSAPGLTPTVSVQMTVPPPGRGMPPPGYLPTYAPSTSTPLDATTVAVAGDDEKTNVDIFLRLVSATTIQGDVQMPTEPGVAMQVMLQIEDATFDGSDNMTTRPDQNGRFYFRTVRPGKYTVMAMTVPAAIPQAPGQPFVQPTLTDAQKVFGRASVTVSGETMINLNLALRPTRSISGVVLFETSRTTDPAQRRGTVTLMQAPGVQQMYYGQMPTAQVAPDGQFVLTGVVPGRYTMRVNSGLLKSLMIGGNDILDFPLDFTGETDVTGAVLTVTDTLSEVSGTLTDAIGKPALGYFILAASTDSRFWTPQSRRVAISYPSPDGRYTFRGLPPGTYSVCALNDFEQGAQYDPEFLKTVAAASISITVIDGGKIQQDIRVK